MASCAFTPSHAPLRGLSLCAGYAGLDLGLGIAEPQYHTVGFVERNAHAAATLVARMGDTALAPALVWDDLRSFDGRPWRDRIHILTAGYPCQPFSVSGLRRGAADPRHLWPEVARIIDEVRPEWVFAENVEGHIDLGFASVCDDLSGLGYTAKAGLFSAAEAGASHRRRRLFVLAHADGRRQREPVRHPDRGRAGALCEDHRPAGGERRAIPVEERGAGVDDPVAIAQRARVAARSACGLFVPGPDELSDWAELLSHTPDAQPAILRTDDGLAGWVDRTTGVGNGVCSMAAALAWAVLKSAFDVEG